MYPMTTHLVSWRYILPTILMLSFTIISIALTLSTLRQEAISTHRNIAKLHTYTVEEIFTQTLQNIDHTMDRIPHLSNEETNPQVLLEIFNDLLKNAPYMRSISLVNMEGVIEESSNQPNIGKQIMINTFLPFPFNDTPLLRVGKPWIGRDFNVAHVSNPHSPISSESINFIPILKKVFFANRPYYLVVSLNPEYFINRYSQALPPSDGKISLWRLDGILLLSTDTSLDIGGSHFVAMHQSLHDSEDLLSHFENTTHSPISAYNVAQLMPFIVEVEMDQTVALGHWDQERNKILLVSIVFISLSGILGLLLILRRDQEAQRQKQQITYEKQFRIAMEATQTGLWTWNKEDDTITWDKQCYLLLGYEPFVFKPSLPIIQSLTHPDDKHNMFASIQEQVALQGWFLVERRMKNPQGEWIWIQVRGRVIEYTQEKVPLFLTGVYINIDAQKQAEQLRLSSVAFETEDAVLITDAQEKIVKVNQAFTRITGYTPAEILGKTPRILSSGQHDKIFYKEMWLALMDKGFWQGELWNKRKNGEIYPEHMTITAIKDSKGLLTHFLANFSDITLRKAAQKQIHEMAYRDPLTRLANRHLLQENIDKAIEKAQQHQVYGALIFIDLDKFKELNDAFGHDAGDMLLIQVARRLQDCTRADDTVSRLGGDEFLILLENLGTEISQATTQTHTVALKILSFLNKPFDLAHGNYHVGASIGVTIFGKTLSTVDELIKQADLAMYEAKNKGRNQISFFTQKNV